jgi:hypothetical protein
MPTPSGGFSLTGTGEALRAKDEAQTALDGFVTRETERSLDEGPTAGRNLLDYEADE